jgi:hypothetical protein
MQRWTQDEDVKNKLVVLVTIILALMVTIFCIVDIILIRRWRAPQPTELPQIVEPATAEPKSIPTVGPTVIIIPTVENTPTPEPPLIVAPPPSLWRFLSINTQDIGTFENVADPNQRLMAVCIDKRRPPPKKGAIYYLDDSGVLKLEDGSKKYQRFKVTGGQ